MARCRRIREMRAERGQRGGDTWQRAVGWGDRLQVRERVELLGEPAHVLEPEATMPARRAHGRDPALVRPAPQLRARGAERPQASLADSLRGLFQLLT